MTSQNDTDKTSNPDKSGKWSRRKLFTTFGVATLVTVGAFAATAHSGSGFFRHGFGHGHGSFMHGAYDPVRFEKHLDKKLKHFAIEFDATDDQQQKLKTVITQLVKEIHPMKDKMRETRDQLQTLLTQPKIDRVAIEKLRAEKIAMVEDISKKVTNALSDAGEILNFEQRKKLAEFMTRFGPGHHRGWRRGWGRGWRHN